jgi:hypothetical protein
MNPETPPEKQSMYTQTDTSTKFFHPILLAGDQVSLL